MNTLLRPLVCRAVFLWCLLVTGSVGAQNYDYANLHTFTGADGLGPEGTLIEGSDGNFYGTTAGSFANTSGAADPATNGTVFKVTSAGVFTTLHVFAGSDGSHPMAPLVQLSNGLLYGTTSGGFSGGGITVFRLATDGSSFVTLVHGTAKEGTTNATLVAGRDGNLYGTNRQGGGLSDGSIFRMTPDGVVTLLYSSTGAPDGEFFNGPLVQAADGNFYGSAGGGGGGLEGAIFRITPAGQYAVLYSLAAFGAEGSGPQALVQAGDGNLYGACQQGGDPNYPPSGTVFRVTTGGAFTKLIDLGEGFGVNPPRAVDPVSNLIVGPDGALYGTGKEGGETGTAHGGVYRVGLDGTYSSVYAFDGVGGAYPFGALLLAGDGNFYGTTAGEAAETDPTTSGDVDGTIFKLSPASATPTPTPPPTPTPTPPPTGTPVLVAFVSTPVAHLGARTPGVVSFYFGTPQAVKTTVKYTLKGSAANGADYVLLTGKVKIKPGKIATVQIVPEGDSSGKTVKLVVTPGSAYTIGVPGALKVKIKE